MDAARTLRLLGMTCSLIEVPDLDLGSVFAAYDEIRRLIESPQHGPGQVFELWEKLRIRGIRETITHFTNRGGMT